MSILDVALDPATVLVAVDPGKVTNRVWVSDGTGLLEQPVSLPVARVGVEGLEAMLAAHTGGEPVIAIEATGSLHRAWVAELERLHPGVDSAVRSLGNQGGAHPAWVGAVQER